MPGFARASGGAEREESGLARAESREHLRQLLRAYVHVFADASPQHGRGDVAPAAFFLRVVQDLEHDAFATREAVANIGQEVPLVLQGLNSVLSFFFTPTALSFTYCGRPSLYGG